MTREAFRRDVLPGTYIYDGKRKVISKVIRIFPDVNPSYAEYFDSKLNQNWAVFYKHAVVITKDKLQELKAKQATKNDLPSNNTDITEQR